ncbi:MAG: glycosyltransferase [Acidobacteria bacterium]|nr:glycosyltransferase [Acidobacteriota bacterium]
MSLRIALTADPELPVPPQFYGGIERVVDMLARELSARGHEVTLFAHPESRTAATLRAWPGASSGRAAHTVANAATLARHVVSGGFDVLHSFSRVAYLLPLLPARLPKLMSYQRAVAPRSVRIGTRLSGGSLWFSAISQAMIRDVRDLGTWRVVPNGVPAERFPFVPRVDGDAPLVFLGRVEEIKGPHLAIEIAKRAGKRLVIAGNIPRGHEGWAAQHVLAHVDGDAVSYVGPVDDAAKATLLGGACGFLMPILWEEPFGIVMAEAMACGTPVLALARGAAPEVVAHGVTGWVCDTVNELVCAVARLGDIERQACRARVLSHYSAQAVTDGYLAVYQELIARRAQAPVHYAVQH